jgi:HEAT repeat protein
MHEQKQMHKFRRSGHFRVWCGALLLFSPSASLKAQTKASDVPKLVQELNDKDPAVRGGAAAALDNLHDTAAEPALIAGLKQSSKNVSATTALVRTIGRFNDAKAVAAIVELLPGEVGHAAAAQLLQMDPLGIQAVADATASESKATQAAVRDSFIDAPELGLKVLPGALKNSQSAAQRAFIVALLADCAAQNPWYEDPPRPAFVKAFLPVAKDSDAQVRIAVASAIGQLAEAEKLEDPGMGHPDFGLEETLPVLRSYAQDQDADVRTAAMDAMGSMANADAISIIKKHLNDPDAGVKQHAAEALAAAQAATPQAAANAKPTPAPKRGAKSGATPKSDEAPKLAQIKKWSDETAIPQLIPLLGDPSSLVRAAAADKLGKLDYRATAMNGADHEQNLSEVPALIEALKDAHALVRAAAAEALGEIGDESAAAPLVALLKDSKPKVLVAAAGALSTMVKGQGGYVQDALTPEDHQAASAALGGLLSSNDQEVRHAALSALVDVSTLDEMKKIVPLLEDNDVFIRNQAARALAQAFYPNPNVERDPKLDGLEEAAGPALARALSAPETRGAAIWALAAMKRPPVEAARPLIENLKYNVWVHADGMSRPEVQATGTLNGFQGLVEIGQAIDVLSRTGNPEAEPLLVKFLNIINPEAGKHACAGLATLGDARAVGPLLEVLQRKGVDLQPEAAQALAAFQDPRIVPALIQALQSDNSSLRGAAAGALGHFHDARVVPALAHSLTDEDSGVRLAVAKALGDLGDPAAVEPLGRVLKTNYEALRALGKIKSPASVTVLVSAMQDKQFLNRSDAVSSLARMDDPRVVPALIQTMEQEVASNTSTTLAVQCVQALGTIKDSRAVEPLKKLLGKPTMASQEAGRVLREMGVSLEEHN